MKTIVKSSEVLGIIAFSLSGIFVAKKRGADIVDVYSLALVMAGRRVAALHHSETLSRILDRIHDYAILLLILAIVSSMAQRDICKKSSREYRT